MKAAWAWKANLPAKCCYLESTFGKAKHVVERQQKGPYAQHDVEAQSTSYLHNFEDDDFQSYHFVDGSKSSLLVSFAQVI